MKKIIGLVVLLCISTTGWGNSAYLSFSEESAELGVGTGGDYSNTVDFGFSGYYNDSDDLMITADMVTNLEGDSSSQWLFSLGAKFFISQFELKSSPKGKSDKKFAFGLMPKIQAGYRFLTTVPIAAVLDFGYSPSILNSSNIRTMQQFGAFLEFMLSPSAIAQVGYRNYTVNFESDIFYSGENYKNFENSIIAGMKLRF